MVTLLLCQGGQPVDQAGDMLFVLVHVLEDIER